MSDFFTPGPWTVGPRRQVLGRAFDNSEKCIVEQVRGGTVPAADANARLIAAAPDLLAACRVLIKYATRRDGTEADFEAVIMTFVEDGSTLTECLESARLAIAKAEGR